MMWFVLGHQFETSTWFVIPTPAYILHNLSARLVQKMTAYYPSQGTAQPVVYATSSHGHGHGYPTQYASSNAYYGQPGVQDGGMLYVQSQPSHHSHHSHRSHRSHRHHSPQIITTGSPQVVMVCHPLYLDCQFLTQLFSAAFFIQRLWRWLWPWGSTLPCLIWRAFKTFLWTGTSRSFQVPT